MSGFSVKVEHSRQPKARGESWVYTVMRDGAAWGILVDERVRSRSLFESSRHHHAQWDEAIVPLEGCYWVGIDSWSRTIAPGEAALIPGGLEHESGIADNLRGIHFLVLLIARDLNVLNGVEPGGVSLASGTQSWIRAAFRMLRYSSSESSFIPLSVLPDFLRTLGRQPRLPSDGSHPDALIAEVLRLIRDSDKVPSLAELAGEVGLTPYHLQRRFKGVTGVSPPKYAQTLRLDAVADALRSGVTLPVSDLAAEHGFNDLKHFRRVFKRRFGIGPSDYRKNAPAVSTARE